ncbi:DUF6474 family protein [Corynebacterium sp. SCR221107]|uniref:DUF6474 family protein n=1 Tax=Corynebacterium sp. SCR221107 TaxID=3017361 RepID=UPI0022EC3C2E|nr:DUF6474 family protein [Corynebacterium sp. SCR221107]WBT08646.1 DUF6474 family protein [Corynebacterium sp. SCR221107]
MGIWKSIRKARTQRKAEIKAAKARARQEVKSAAKLELKKDQLLARQESRLLKEEKKAQKIQRKHELALAKTELARRQAGKFNKDRVLRYAAATRALAPVVVPLIYRGVTTVREQLNAQRAAKLGVSSDELASFSGYGAPLQARIAGMRKSVSVSSLPKGFITDCQERLDELSEAVNNAEFMGPEQRVRAHRSIAKDLDALGQQIQEKIEN